MAQLAKPTLILGASENPARYSYLAASRLLAHGHPIYLIGARAGKLNDHPIQSGFPDIEGVDTVTLYLGPARQEPYLQYLIHLNPKRVIFNPGTENDFFMDSLEAAGISTIEACTLVMLATGQY